MQQRLCISCNQHIDSLQKATQIPDGRGLVYLLCEKCVQLDVPGATVDGSAQVVHSAIEDRKPIQKGGGALLVSKSFSPRKQAWQRVEIAPGFSSWQAVD